MRKFEVIGSNMVRHYNFGTHEAESPQAAIAKVKETNKYLVVGLKLEAREVTGGKAHPG